jgi:hypothetical protein
VGRRLRVSSYSSPIRCKKYCLGACTNLGRCNPCRLANRYKIPELFPFLVTWPPVIHSSSLPLSLRFKMALRALHFYRTKALIDILQDSIPGVLLALTQAGFPPACQSAISSPHMHVIVLLRLSGRCPSGLRVFLHDMDAIQCDLQAIGIVQNHKGCRQI